MLYITLVSMILPLLQRPSISPAFFPPGERIALASNSPSLSFTGFSHADMIEIIPAGIENQRSIYVTSAAIRNLMLGGDARSYEVRHQKSRGGDALTFRPADLGQETILVLTVPQGMRLQISYSGNRVPISGPLEESLLLHDLAVQRGAPGSVVALLNKRLKNGVLVLPAKPPEYTKATIIHQARPELSRDERRVLYQVFEGQRSVFQFEITVTDTGQVIEARPVSGTSVALPRRIAEKLKDAVMRYTFEPYVIDGKASSFRTMITLQLP
jgi:hypothetical protein